jgi:hypothetical protein
MLASCGASSCGRFTSSPELVWLSGVGEPLQAIAANMTKLKANARNFLSLK